jgi:hypothetical protein
MQAAQALPPQGHQEGPKPKLCGPNNRRCMRLIVNQGN